MRRIAAIVVLVACVLQSGCLGLLAAAAMGPRAVATGMAQNIAYEAVRGLGDVPLSESAAPAETIANIDRILEEHPDAANRDSLTRLREHLAERVGDETGTSDGVDERTLQGGITPGVAAGRATDGAHDRRSAGVTATPLANALAGRPSDPTAMRSGLRLEQPDAPDQRLRSRDPWRVTVPTGSSMTRLAPGRGVIRLDTREHTVLPAPPRG